jgi:4a-hydroxytetrahydrobiopterin dehydratase
VEPITPAELTARKCRPCEGDIPKCPLEQSQAQLAWLPGWELTHEGNRIRKDWTVKSFRAGVEFLNRVAVLAEQEGHHPDVHLEGYRHVWIELWTHAVGGLSENDFILAAKIDRLPIEVRGAPRQGQP